jgi:hypothetical protein
MTLGEMLNMARGVQAYQQAGQINPLALRQQQAETAYAEEAKPELLKKVKIEAEKARRTLEPEVGSVEETFKQRQIETKSKALGFNTEQANAIANRLTAHINDPLVLASEKNPNSINKEELGKLVSKYSKEQASALGIDPEKAEQLAAPYITMATTNPAGYRQFLKSKLLSTLDASQRISAMQPSGVAVSTGAGGATVQTGEFGAYAPGQQLPGTSYVQQLPPTTPITSPQGQPGYLGPATAKGNQFVAGGLTPGSAAAITAPVEYFQKDWPEVQAEAKQAQSKIGILQNINALADKAFTGVGGSRKALAAGIANAVGIPLFEAEKTATDELAKNSAVLQMAGGNTDAARAIAEAMVPGGKINREAIRGVVNQLVGVETYKQKKQDVLSRYTNDPTQYATISQQVNRIDPKIFQEMTPEQVKALKKNMPQAQQKDIADQINLAKSLGMLK